MDNPDHVLTYAAVALTGFGSLVWLAGARTAFLVCALLAVSTLAVVNDWDVYTLVDQLMR